MTKLIRIENPNQRDLDDLIAYLKTKNMSFEVEEETEYELNEETLKSFEDAKNGKVTKYKSTAELFAKFKK